MLLQVADAPSGGADFDVAIYSTGDILSAIEHNASGVFCRLRVTWRRRAALTHSIGRLHAGESAALANGDATMNRNNEY